MKFFTARTEPTAPDITPAQQAFIARQKFLYMYAGARSSTPGMLIGALLCIPLFMDSVSPWKLWSWMGLIVLGIVVRLFLLRIPNQEAQLTDNVESLIQRVSWATFVTSLAWGLGWFLVAYDMTRLEQLEFFLVLQMVAFLGMINYCIHLPSYAYFFLPLKLPEFIVEILLIQTISWPIICGSVITALYSLKMVKAFGKSWESAILLQMKNDELFEKLVQERDVSVAANLAKSNFIAIASHDLRQPMHAITLYLNALKNEDLGPKNQDILGKIKSAVGTINQMFSALLNISRFDAQNVAIKHERFSLAQLAADLQLSAGPQAQAKSLLLAFDYQDATVEGDLQLLKQALLNIISNAIQYTDQGGVTVRFVVYNACLSVEVADTGKGIDEADRDKIFQEFYRSHKTRSDHDGLGLGLSIVKRICELTGSSIHFEPLTPNGTRFTLQTPFPLSPELPAQTLASHQASQAASQADLGLAAKPLPGHGLVIGLLENDPHIHDAYLQALSKLGFEVVSFSENETELQAQLARLHKLDCLLTDYHLTHSTGDVFISRIRDEFNENIPAIIVSGDTTPAALQKLEALSLSVLHKPVDVERIAHEIYRLTRTVSA
jgi:signal transduction histidine kinase/CheY-like chemotaxis protein